MEYGEKRALQAAFGLTLSPATITAVYLALLSTAPEITVIQTGTNQTADVSSLPAQRSAYRLLLGKGLIRIFEPLPAAPTLQFSVLSVARVAVGELFTSARPFAYIGALAPKGQEGLFLGYANLPTAIGALLGGPFGALIFNGVMCRGESIHSPGFVPGWQIR